jgi:hypothetical protein
VAQAIGEIETTAGKMDTAADQLGRAAIEVSNQTSRIRTRVTEFTDDIQAMRA